MSRGFMPGFIVSLVAVIFWGVQLPVAKDAFVAVNPFHLSLFRYCVAVACLVPFLVAREGWAALSYRGLGGRAIVLGLVGMCLSPMGAFVGMSLSSAEHCVVLGALQPTMAVLAMWFMKRQRPANFTLVCIALAFAGVVLVVTNGNLEFINSTSQLIGDLTILLGAGCWVIYTAGIGRLTGWSTWRITVLTMIPGTLGTMLLTSVLVSVGHIHPPSVADLQSVAWQLAYLSLIGVTFSMMAWNFGSRRIGVLNSSLLINFMPVVTFTWRALHGHAFHRIELLGAAMVVGALIANNMFLRRQYLARTQAD
ncbi:MAG: DMT family transporter [Proteobacteria bacterium]|jgi:drug/metabolite transporter (DMT)-like permease|nr:DMT family transporter [Pseudomonadota bacterium]